MNKEIHSNKKISIIKKIRKNMENQAKNGRLFVISGPSGVGKTTLTIETIKRLPEDCIVSKVITYTTRPKRESEINGQDYYFVSHNEFDKKFKENFFLETTKYDGHMYGSPISILEDLKLGQSFAIITDIEGVKNIEYLHNGATFIWISAPSIKALRERIVKRTGLKNKTVEDRLSLAETEIKEAHQKTRIIEYFVVNENFDQAVNELCTIIKEKLS